MTPCSACRGEGIDLSERPCYRCQGTGGEVGTMPRSVTAPYPTPAELSAMLPALGLRAEDVSSVLLLPGGPPLFALHDGRVVEAMR